LTPGTQSFEYANPMNGHTIAIQIAPAWVSSGDLAKSAKFCAATEKYTCVSSESFNFAVPRERGDLPSEWTYAGYQYKLIGRRHLWLLDRSLQVWDIESTQAGNDLRFLYSRKNGLVAFSSSVDGQPVVFISQRNVGFAQMK
jgi:hypothetical protein